MPPEEYRLLESGDGLYGATDADGEAEARYVRRRSTPIKSMTFVRWSDGSTAVTCDQSGRSKGLKPK